MEKIEKTTDGFLEKAYMICLRLFASGIIVSLIGIFFTIILGDNENTRNIFWFFGKAFTVSFFGFSFVVFTFFSLKSLRENIKNKNPWSFLILISFIAIIFVFAAIVRFATASKEETKYVYFGENGYTEYQIIGNDSIRGVFYNTGKNSYYIITEIKVKPIDYYQHSKFYQRFIYDDYRDSLVHRKKVVYPNDTVFVKKSELLVGRWSGHDECGNPIPFKNIQYVGYFDKEGFHKRE